MLGGGLGGAGVLDSPLITRPHFWDHWKEILWVEGPQTKPGSGFLHALGPKAEGEELKISGRLWWPPALAPPSGTAAQLGPHPGAFWEHFLLLLSTPGNSKTRPSKRSEIGAGQQGVG